MVVWSGSMSQKWSHHLISKMPKIGKNCCQKCSSIVAKRICRVLIVPSFTLASVESQWAEKASHCQTTARHHGAAPGMGPDKTMDHDPHHLAWHCLVSSDGLWSSLEPAWPSMGVYPPQDLACWPGQNLWKVSWSPNLDRACNNMLFASTEYVIVSQRTNQFWKINPTHTRCWSSQSW